MKKNKFLYFSKLASIIFISACSQGTPQDAPSLPSSEAEEEPFLCREVKPNFIGMKGIQSPSVKNIMALGQLGGTLCPTLPPQNKLRSSNHTLSKQEILEQNRMFGHAMDLWNEHSYKEASKELHAYLEKYPDGLWAGEAELHLGCEARFNGRYNEADKLFKDILEKYKGDSSGHKRISDKAKSRLAVLRILENNPEDAIKGGWTS